MSLLLLFQSSSMGFAFVSQRTKDCDIIWSNTDISARPLSTFTHVLNREMALFWNSSASLRPAVTGRAARGGLDVQD